MGIAAAPSQGRSTLAGVGAGTGESGARVLKGGGALQEIARALFVRASAQRRPSRQDGFRRQGRTAAGCGESIIADGQRCSRPAAGAQSAPRAGRRGARSRAATVAVFRQTGQLSFDPSGCRSA